MHKLRFRYATDTPYVLKDVSLEIKPGEKVSDSSKMVECLTSMYSFRNSICVVSLFTILCLSVRMV